MVLDLVSILGGVDVAEAAGLVTEAAVASGRLLTCGGGGGALEGGGSAILLSVYCSWFLVMLVEVSNSYGKESKSKANPSPFDFRIFSFSHLVSLLVSISSPRLTTAFHAVLAWWTLELGMDQPSPDSAQC